MKTIMSMMAAPLVAVAMSGGAVAGGHDDPPAVPPTESLQDTIAALDAAVFDAFNTCSDPAQLDRHAGYFASDVEFYHDTGGVTHSRTSMLQNTAKHVCGKFRRELVPGTLKVFPIKDYGAIEQGAHRFCHFDSGKCEGMADFVIVWHNQNGLWKITRVLSYGHRPND
ncbi:nuclear transport factor 2 family protein [Lysobacter sp. LF1]|uniref:Nuclear transport factor 2 family protein n=1 Tax=Lysobacter stagni TaxID=3045172 RepID=A0ABT6XDQ0_9GAMM|nr:nuclear transport factor 2 family protein [Lysobacter sp. LF1]MDI9238266.1 nuclear transport factor 2 family protein [Lysobacter sp. LF1]